MTGRPIYFGGAMDDFLTESSLSSEDSFSSELP